MKNVSVKTTSIMQNNVSWLNNLHGDFDRNIVDNFSNVSFECFLRQHNVNS